MLFSQGEGGVEETIHPFGFCYNPRLGKWTTTGLLIIALVLVVLTPDDHVGCLHCANLRHDGEGKMSLLTDGVQREALRHRRL